MIIIICIIKRIEKKKGVEKDGGNDDHPTESLVLMWCLLLSWYFHLMGHRASSARSPSAHKTLRSDARLYFTKETN